MPPTPHAYMHCVDSTSMKLFSAPRFSMHAFPPSTPMHKKGKESRKHSYCLLQSLMKNEIPPLKRGEEVRKRGGEAQRLAAAEESAARRGQQEVGGEDQL